MNSKQIQNLLERLIDPSRVCFAGVFPRDQIPNHLKDTKQYPYCFVANTDTSDSHGTHWVAFFYPDKNSCEFFDSYGLHPIVDYHFQLPPVNDFQMSNYTYQAYNSNVCGHYVIYFLAKRSLSFSFLAILDSFLKGSPEYNDILVHQYVRRRFKIRNYLPSIIHFHSSLCKYIQFSGSRSRSHSCSR